MKALRIIFLVLGLLLILFNFMGTFNAPKPKIPEGVEGLAYTIGWYMFYILGVIFLIIYYWMYRKAMAKKLRIKNDEQLESIGSNN